MKALYLIIVVILFTSIGTINADVRLYSSPKGDIRIKVEDNYMSIYTHEYNNMLLPATICTYKRVRCDYYVINSIKSQPAQQMSPIISVDSLLNTCDSIYVKFELKNFNKAYSLALAYNFNKIIKCDLTGDCHIKVGKDSNLPCVDVNFFLAPSIYSAFLPNGSYVGAGLYNGSISSKYWGKSITVLLDFISADYFSKIYIIGDYIRMTDDDIQWRNVIFHRTNKL